MGKEHIKAITSSILKTFFREMFTYHQKRKENKIFSKTLCKLNIHKVEQENMKSRLIPINGKCFKYEQRLRYCKWCRLIIENKNFKEEVKYENRFNKC